MVLAEPIRVTVLVTATLDALGIPYLVGGSLASSVHGVPRSTADVDLVADIGTRHVEALVSSLQEEFYVDDDMIQEAIRRRSSFNIIHLSTMYKVDIFIPRDEPFSAEELRRAEPQDLGEHVVRVATAEDIVLEKLRWYGLGGEVSDQQWRDVLGVLCRSIDRMDRDYLRRWSQEIGVEDLLARALIASEREEPKEG